MKLFVICFVGLVALVVADTEPHSRGCRYIMGRCVEDCPVGTHAYTTGCDYKMPEATCENPEPTLDTRGKLCDYSSCYCASPTVRDTVSDTCVELKDCPKKET